MKTDPVLFALSAMVFASVAGAQPQTAPCWSVRAGWEHTSLGAARPDGFGSTGGHGARVGVERVISGERWPIAALLDARAYGFLSDAPRTVGVELDLGVDLGRRLMFSAASVDVGGTLSVGMFRAPLETAIGRWRFIGWRPFVAIAVAYRHQSGAGLHGDVGCRYYSTLAWSGCSWGGSVSGAWSW